MAPEDEKYIEGESSSEKHRQKIISGEDIEDQPPGKIIAGNSSPVRQSDHLRAGQTSPDRSFDAWTQIQMATKNGGLNRVPEDFDHRNGSWTTIRSENPFTILYLDYRQHLSITPEMVSGNYHILSEFWKEKLLIMNRGARDQIEKRYGAGTVNEAPKRLDAAYDSIKTKEGILLHFKEADGRRIREGISSLDELLELSLHRSDFSEREAGIIIQKGVRNGLEAGEVKDHILAELSKRGFKPRVSDPDPEHPFRNKWMTDEAWDQYQRREMPVVEWMGVKVSSLEEIGTITFSRKDDAFFYLKNTNFLPPLVAKLTNSATKAVAFEKIFEEEREIERRYLSIVYHLNPSLPFRFDGGLYTNIKDLLTAACQSEVTFKKLGDYFLRGHVHIWLKETDAQMAQLLPSQTGEPNGFVRFVYAISKDFPFFVNGEKFFTPAGLTAKAKQERAFWIPLSMSIENGNLFSWLSALGKERWIRQYNERFQQIIDSGIYGGDPLRLAAVQALILVVDSTILPPDVQADQPSISLLAVEGGSIIQKKIRLRLKNDGFVKGTVKLDSHFDGIVLKGKEIAFESLTGALEQEIELTIEATKLSKEKLYKFNILVSTIFTTLTIPVEVKVVFPLRSFIVKVAVYGVAGAAFFGATRFLLALLTGYYGWISAPANEPFSLSSVDWLPGYPLVYLLLLVVFVYAGYRIARWVKKIEKLK